MEPEIGSIVRCTGRLSRDGGAFILKGEDGRVWRLTLSRTPVDHVEKRVLLQGVYAGADMIDVDGISAA